MPVYYNGVHPIVPPDKHFEGLVDDYGKWYEVKLLNVDDLLTYQYASVESVNFILKSIAESN